MIATTLLFAAMLAAQSKTPAPARPAAAQPKPAARAGAVVRKTNLDTPAVIEAAGQQAAAARQANRIDDAVAIYERTLARNPNWTDGWWGLGTIFYEKDRYPACRDAMQQLIALDANAGPGWIMLGLCEYGNKAYDRSLAALRRAAEFRLTGKDSLSATALYHLAVLLASYGEFEQSQGYFVTLAQESNPDSQTIFAAGIAALRRPLMPEKLPAEERELTYLAGKAFLDAAARDKAAAQAEFEALAEKYPAAPGVHYLLGTYLISIGEERGAEELKKEVEISPRHVPARVQLALEYLKRGNTDAALPFARDSVQLAPDSRAAQVAYGRVLLGKQNFTEAATHFEQARELDPGDPQTRFLLFTTYAKLGRKADAQREQAEFKRLRAESTPPQ